MENKKGTASNTALHKGKKTKTTKQNLQKNTRYRNLSTYNKSLDSASYDSLAHRRYSTV
jgi:hypothetical protein